MKTIRHGLAAVSVMAMAMAGLSTLAEAQETSGVDDALLRQFQSPPEASKPRCFWYWHDGKYSKEGLTKDLEAMRRAGIGQAYIATIGISKAGGAFSDEWWGYLEHAIREGSRIGVGIGLFICPGGWTCAGGPWVKTEQSMRGIVIDEIKVQGPGAVPLDFPKPKANASPILVQAFPVPARDDDDIMKHSPKVLGDLKNGLVYEVAEPFTARSLSVVPLMGKRIEAVCELGVSEDGKAFRPVCQFPIRRYPVEKHPCGYLRGWLQKAPVTFSFGAVTARFFSLKITSTARIPEPVEVGPITLSTALRVTHYADKQLGVQCLESQPGFYTYTWPATALADQPSQVVDPRSVRTIQPDKNAEGKEVWNAPAGQWVVQRIMAVPSIGDEDWSRKHLGYRSWEVDKMSPAAIREHMAAYVGRLYDHLSPEDRRSLKTIVLDSWEVGFQNWTDDLFASFQASFGYDPHPYLPVLNGRVVGNSDHSDRFLWDLRRLVSDRIVRDFAGTLREETHRRGMKLWVENYQFCPQEMLAYGGAADEVSSEFWGHPHSYDPFNLCYTTGAASVAHTYGKKEVFAEAFTCGPQFRYNMAALKAQGDVQFCMGINQFVLHLYEHQPEERRPGVWKYGFDFNRHNTWFAHAQPWTDYLRRCSVMLQAGKPVSDVAYYITEDVPKLCGPREPALPAGYNFDWINAEVILNRLSVKEERFVLPEGTSYKLLVLPPSRTMRPAVLKKIGELVAAGGAVLCTEAPSCSPSLQDYPACDQSVQTLAKEIWSSGKIIANTNLVEVLAQLNTPPDAVAPKGITWKHRQAGDREIYFVSNQSAWPAKAKLSFRVSGLAAELWHPVAAQRRPLTQMKSTSDGRTEIELEFEPNESYFVVFGKVGTDRRAVRLESGAPGGRALPNFPQYKPVQELKGAWDLQFDPQWFYPDNGTDGKVKFEKLEDWTKRSEPAIKYYSGTAIYRKTFEYSAQPGHSSPLFLDLGEVLDLAKVKLNGQELGCIWTPPHRLALGAALKDGTNTLEIEVVNRWINRLVGDDTLEKSQRRTLLVAPASRRIYGKDLLPSGLLGPVRVMAEE